jgi:hypothetical protein
LKILHENCDPKLAEDRTLPYNAFIVTYQVNNEINYDITTADKRVDLFDFYWDKYREGLIGWKQSEGRMSPRTWGEVPKESKDSKKRK